LFPYKETGEDSAVISAGEVLDNSNAYEMTETITELQNEGFTRIFIDMSSLRFLSSAGVGSILGSVGGVRQAGGDIILANPPEKILHILEILDLCEYLTVQKSAGARHGTGTP
jgi:anti-sigma B factor antagonist